MWDSHWRKESADCCPCFSVHHCCCCYQPFSKSLNKGEICRKKKICSQPSGNRTRDFVPSSDFLRLFFSSNYFAMTPGLHRRYFANEQGWFNSLNCSIINKSYSCLMKTIPTFENFFLYRFLTFLTLRNAKLSIRHFRTT